MTTHDTAEALEAAIDNLRRVDRQSYASGGVESVWPARKALLAAIAADRARAVAEAVDLDAIALAADLIGRHLAPTSDVARGAVARLEAMLAGKPARPTPDEARRLLDEYDRASRHSYVTGGPEHLRAARTALLRALGGRGVTARVDGPYCAIHDAAHPPCDPLDAGVISEIDRPVVLSPADADRVAALIEERPAPTKAMRALFAERR